MATSDPFSTLPTTEGESTDSNKSLNKDNITFAVGVAEDLATIATDIPDTSGWSTVFSKKDLGEFGTQVAAFATGLNSFLVATSSPFDNLLTDNGVTSEVTTTSGSEQTLNKDSINYAVDIASKLADVAKKLNEQDTSWWEEIFKTAPNLGTFGSEIATFANGLVTFLTDVNSIFTSLKDAEGNSVDINFDNIDKAVSSIDKLADLAKKVNEYNDSGWFNTNLEEFGSQINTFGTSMSTYAGVANGIVFTNFDSVISHASKLFGLAKDISGSTIQDESGTSSLASFGAEIVNFGKCIKTFHEKISEVDDGKVSSLVRSVNTISYTMKTLSGFDYETIDTASLQTKLSELSSAISTFANDFPTADASESITQITAVTNMLAGLSSVDFSGVSSFQTALVTLSEAGIDAFVLAFENAVSDATTAVEAFALGSADGASSASVYLGFFRAGKDVVNGFAAGIDENTWKAEAQARVMAERAIRIAKATLAINSPSKVFAKIGEGIPEGFAMGVDKLSYLAEDSAVAMADNTLSTTKSVLSNLAYLIDSDIESQPTIRPVLDLSNIESGTSRIAGLFDMSPSIRTMANLSAINSAMNKNQNGTTNDDVVSAIKDLGRKIGNTGDTYNMNGITYDDGSNISNAMKDIVRAAKIERRT